MMRGSRYCISSFMPSEEPSRSRGVSLAQDIDYCISRLLSTTHSQGLKDDLWIADLTPMHIMADWCR
jgi:hypothetical protein